MAENVANPQGATEYDPDIQQRILNIVKAPQQAPKEEEVVEEKGTDESPAPEPQEEAQPAKEAETIEIDPDAKLFEVELTVEGGEKKSEKLSLNDLKAQRMMQSDYQRKTAELARQREDVQVQIRQGIEKTQTEYMQALQAQEALIWNAVAPDLQKVDWDKLAVEDPAQFVQMSNRATKVQQTIQAIRAEQQKLVSQEQEYRKNVLAPKANEELRRDIPNWDLNLYQGLLKTAISDYGFKPEEVNEVVDPRMMKVLHDAFQYRKLKSEKTIADKKVVEKPKTLKPGGGQEPQVNQDAFKRLGRTGHIQDAAAVILQGIKSGKM